MTLSQAYQSWGRYPLAAQRAIRPEWRDEIVFPNDGATVLPYGCGRSYGDCCLNDGGLLIDTNRLNRFITFDADTGILRCEAGVGLDQIIRVCLPQGWFLPVSPGTRYVSIGGAIANDIHGKNHHQAGTFGRYVRSFELLRSDGEILLCSPKSNAELFQATIAGMGLTGLMLTVEVQLKKVAGAFIDMESVKFGSIDEFFEVSKDSEEDFEYTVAWLDCLATGKSLGRGIFMRGNHSPQSGEISDPWWQKYLCVPFDFPSIALNKLSIRAFNTVYYNKQFEKVAKKTVLYEPFFYPLDAVQHWNRIYGSRGFFQFQAVVPVEKGRVHVKTLLNLVARSGKASFLVVFKEFGNLTSPGMMSFPRPGATICLDFPNDGRRTLDLLRRLEEVVNEAGGALYAAKDACMLPRSFRQYYPQWKEFAEYIDPGFSSSFWRRVTSGERV